MSHLGTGCLVAGFFILAKAAGSLAFADLFGGAATAGGLRGLVFVLFLAAFVYAAIRDAWRLHKGDVEEAGSDGRTFRR